MFSVETAKQIIAHFGSHDIPQCDAAVDDEQTMVGFEWTFADGSYLWLDINANGKVDCLWRESSSTRNR